MISKEEKITALVKEQKRFRAELDDVLVHADTLRAALKFNVQTVNKLSHQIRNPEEED